MSREIKFRVWDIDNKEFVYISETVDGEIWINNGFSTVEMPTHKEPYEQYTGLKDKNGEEIYEGDVLQIDDHILGDFPVVWHNLGWKIKRSVGYESLSVHKSDDIAVIGNIHENPELLGGE